MPKLKKIVRSVMADTGLTYTFALKLVTGERVLTPKAPDCTFQAALTNAGAKPPGPATETFPCNCPRCDP